jgi:hypothetical protein
LGEAIFWEGKEGFGRVRFRVPSQWVPEEDGRVRGEVGRLRCDAVEGKGSATCG